MEDPYQTLYERICEAGARGLLHMTETTWKGTNEPCVFLALVTRDPLTEATRIEPLAALDPDLVDKLDDPTEEE